MMVELPADRRRVSRVLRKGNFLDPGDPVEPGVPRALHPYPPGPRRIGSDWRTGWSTRRTR